MLYVAAANKNRRHSSEKTRRPGFLPWGLKVKYHQQFQAVIFIIRPVPHRARCAAPSIDHCSTQRNRRKRRKKTRGGLAVSSSPPQTPIRDVGAHPSPCSGIDSPLPLRRPVNLHLTVPLASRVCFRVGFQLWRHLVFHLPQSVHGAGGARGGAPDGPRSPGRGPPHPRLQDPRRQEGGEGGLGGGAAGPRATNLIKTGGSSRSATVVWRLKGWRVDVGPGSAVVEITTKTRVGRWSPPGVVGTRSEANAH